MDPVFDENKKYRIIINRDGINLNFTATKLKIIGALITFFDRDGKQYVFPLETLAQADEVRK